jgi:hypothetical protein
MLLRPERSAFFAFLIARFSLSVLPCFLLFAVGGTLFAMPSRVGRVVVDECDVDWSDRQVGYDRAAQPPRSRCMVRDEVVSIVLPEHGRSTRQLLER